MGFVPEIRRQLSHTDGKVQYHVRGIPVGFSLMFVAGTLSGLLGIGSGAVKFSPWIRL